MGRENILFGNSFSDRDRQQPNDGEGSPPYRGEGDGAPVGPIKERG